MLDVGLLESIARPPAGVIFGPPPLRLDEIFARVVADGWAPRNPCVDPEELGRLETSTARGDCLDPLVQAGDLIYVHPHQPAQPGDLVSFMLSERGAAAQNSALPPGQSPCRACDRWLKMIVSWRGTDMLLDNMGSAATATLLSCEHPDDKPILWPVRNILRRGRLLFTPDTRASQIGLNAASVVAAAVSSGTQTLVLPVSGAQQNLDAVSVSYTSTGAPTGIDVTGDVAMVHTNFASPASGLVTVRRDGSDVGTAQFDAFQAWSAMHSSTQWWRGQVTLTVDDMPTAGAHTYTLHMKGTASGTSGNANFQITNAAIKVREYRR